MHPFRSKDVEAAFAAYPDGIRAKLYVIRELIFSASSSIEAIGPITETLKWGEPAYLTEASRSGSTVRIGWKTDFPSRYAIYFNCQTTLVDTFRSLYPELNFEGNRALLLNEDDRIDEASVSRCIELALTYHRWKKTGVRSMRA